MIRLLEIFVALIIVAILAVVFAIALPNHRHIDKQKVYSAPVRQIYDVLDGYRTYPSWPAPLRAFDPKVRFDFQGPESGSGAKLNWTGSADAKLGNGGFTIIPDPVQDKQVRWALENNWKGTGKTLTWDLEPAENGKTVKVTLGYDVDYGWDLLARYSGLYVGGQPSALIELHLDDLEKFLATVPNVDYKDTAFELKDVAARPILYVSTTAKRSLDEVADATDKALTAINADIKKNKLTQTGPRITVTSNWGDENYDFDIAVPVEKTDDITPADPVKVGTTYAGKVLTTSFTGSPAQLPLTRLLLKAYALTHGYAFDDSGTGPGRFYDELTTTDANAAEDNQSFTVSLPVTIQQ
ncbi:MAG: hypothetical protein JSS59_08330 [Proteobacteria bacterium]|uniref:hypothetical protein n=1 Tax=Rudaea sp. TaxID=2136325 RepID=UPI0037832285|nr:hypothetical protein [Pseudomonadota bacterium]